MGVPWCGLHRGPQGTFLRRGCWLRDIQDRALGPTAGAQLPAFWANLSMPSRPASREGGDRHGFCCGRCWSGPDSVGCASSSCRGLPGSSLPVTGASPPAQGLAPEDQDVRAGVGWPRTARALLLPQTLLPSALPGRSGARPSLGTGAALDPGCDFVLE